MGRRFIVCIFALVAFSASAAHGVHGGHNGQSVSAGADGGNGSNGGDIDNSSGRAGCPGGTDPDKHGHFYLPGTSPPCTRAPREEENGGSPRGLSARFGPRFAGGGENLNIRNRNRQSATLR